MTQKTYSLESISTAILLLLFMCPKTTHSQSDSNSFSKENTIKKFVSFDVAPLDLSLSFCYRIRNKFSIGISGEFGLNFTDYFVAAGSHFAKPITLIKYEELDEFENEQYQSIMGGAIFTRLFFEKKIPVDIGLKSDFFFHYVESPNDNSDQTGLFSGVFVKAFIPTKYKYKNGKKKRKPSIGLQVMAGQLREQRGRNPNREFGIITSVWVRFDAKYNS